MSLTRQQADFEAFHRLEVAPLSGLLKAIYMLYFRTFALFEATSALFEATFTLL
jgi:hypothetical protein